MTLFASPACSIVNSSSVSALVGNAVLSVYGWLAAPGEDLQTNTPLASHTSKRCRELLRIHEAAQVAYAVRQIHARSETRPIREAHLHARCREVVVDLEPRRHTLALRTRRWARTCTGRECARDARRASTRCARLSGHR